MRKAITMMKKIYLILGILMITLSVFGQNSNSPFAVDDYYTALKNMPFQENVLTNDSDIDGDSLILNTTPIVNPNQGTITINPDGTFTYIPNINFIGSDAFQYMICDDGTPILCDTAFVYLNVIDSTDFIANITSTNITDCGVTDGTIDIQIHSIWNSLEYSVDNGINWFQNGTFTGLDTGNYHILVKEIGTNKIDTFVNNPLIITAPVAPVINSVAYVNPSNCGVNDGDIIITATGLNSEYSIDGGLNWQSSGIFTGLAIGTYNVLVRNTDGTCETFYINNSVILTAPNAPSITNIVTTDPTDCGVTDGTITITATGGTAPLEYSIDNGTNWLSNSGIFTGLSGGTYNISIRNAGGTCVSSSVIVFITEPVAPVFTTVAYSNPTNCNSNDGQISIGATFNPTPGIEFSIDGGSIWQPSNTFTNLSSGTYNVVVRNADGTCETPYSNNPVIINNPPTNAGNDTTICINSNPITLNGTPLGGTWSGTGIINPSTGAFDPTVAGLGIHLLTYTNGCSTDIMMITVTNLQIVTVPNNMNICIDEVPFYLTATPSGGFWTGTGVVDSIGLFDPSVAGVGTYQLTYEYNDSIGCSVNTYQIITVSPLPVVFAGIDQTYCNQTQNIQLNTPSPPSGGFWSGSGIVDNINGIFSPNIAGGVGSYNLTYTYTGSNNCSNHDSVTITIIEFADFNTATYQYNNDSLTINLVNNNGLEYSIDSGLTWQNSNIFHPVSSGDYNIAVRYLNSSCITYDNLLLNPVIAVNDTFYNNPNAQGNVVANDIGNNVTASLVYYPLNGFVSTFDTLGNFTYIPNAGFIGTDTFKYQICHNDFPTLCDTAMVVIHLTDTLVLQHVIHLNTTDCIIPNGMIDITALTNASTLQYSIDSGTVWLTNNVFTNLTPGYYHIMVNNGIDTIAYTANPIEILLPTSAKISTISKTNPTDCGVNDGTITLTTINGTGQELYTIDGGTTWQSSNIFTGLAEGNYDRIYIGVNNPNNNCTWFTSGNSIVLTAPLPPTINNVTITNPTNCTTTNGEIQINATSSNNLEYSIDNGLTWNTNNHFTSLSCGNYNIWVQNNDATCAVNYGQLSLQTSLTIDTVLTSSMLCGQQNGEIEIIAQGGSGNYSYSIDSGLTWQSSPIFNNLSVGSYPVFVHDGIDTIPYTDINPIILIAGGLPYFNTIYDGDSLVINTIYTGNWEYSLDCGTTWQISNVFYPITDTANCIGVRAADGSCLFFEQDTLNNSLPVAVLDSFPVQQSTSQTVNILTNDFDVENNALYTIPSVIYFGNDSVTIDSFGNLTIPTGDFDLGINTISYQVCETYLPTNCTQGTAIFTVIPAPEYMYDTIAIGSNYSICPTFDLTTDAEYILESCMTPATLVLDSLIDNCFYYYADNYGVYTACLVACDSIGMCDTTYLNITVQDGVWPGDTDDDTEVNNFDLLNIGLAYGTSGTPRDSITTVWNGYITPLWNITTSSTNIDYRHADCNGDGIVNAKDTVAILQNYGLSYTKNGGGNTGIPLYVEIDNDFVIPNFSLPINLGNMATPASTIYGGAFSVLYDTSLIKKNSVYITFDNSWIGMSNTDMISIHKNFGNQQQIDAAFTRIDGINVSGFGQIGTLNFTIKDDIFQRGFNTDSVLFTFDIINPKFIDYSETEIPINAETTNWNVTSTQNVSKIGKNITIFPNPTREFVHIKSPTLPIENIVITDVVGRTVLEKQPINNRMIKLNLSVLKMGVYYLKLETEKGKVVRKLVVLE